MLQGKGNQLWQIRYVSDTTDSTIPDNAVRFLSRIRRSTNKEKPHKQSGFALPACRAQPVDRPASAVPMLPRATTIGRGSFQTMGKPASAMAMTRSAGPRIAPVYRGWKRAAYSPSSSHFLRVAYSSWKKPRWANGPPKEPGPGLSETRKISARRFMARLLFKDNRPREHRASGRSGNPRARRLRQRPRPGYRDAAIVALARDIAVPPSGTAGRGEGIPPCLRGVRSVTAPAF